MINLNFLIYKLGYWNSRNGQKLESAKFKFTENIRDELTKFIKKKIKLFLISLRDFWMRKIDLKKINYTGGDIVKNYKI